MRFTNFSPHPALRYPGKRKKRRKQIGSESRAAGEWVGMEKSKRGHSVKKSSPKTLDFRKLYLYTSPQIYRRLACSMYGCTE